MTGLKSYLSFYPKLLGLTLLQFFILRFLLVEPKKLIRLSFILTSSYYKYHFFLYHKGQPLYSLRRFISLISSHFCSIFHIREWNFVMEPVFQMNEFMCLICKWNVFNDDEEENRVYRVRERGRKEEEAMRWRRCEKTVFSVAAPHIFYRHIKMNTLSHDHMYVAWYCFKFSVSFKVYKIEKDSLVSKSQQK